jgi:hypothetical protein
MKKAFKKLLEIISDPSGQLSNMRFNSTVVSLTICFCLVWLTVVLKLNLADAFCWLLGIAMTGKVAQRKFENFPNPPQGVAPIQVESPSPAGTVDSPSPVADKHESEVPNGN